MLSSTLASRGNIQVEGATRGAPLFDYDMKAVSYGAASLTSQAQLNFEKVQTLVLPPSNSSSSNRVLEPRRSLFHRRPLRKATLHRLAWVFLFAKCVNQDWHQHPVRVLRRTQVFESAEVERSAVRRDQTPLQRHVVG